jgi:predicted AAA+ superfamily ATPase
VEEDYRPGRLLLTGSANLRTLPRVDDSLAGRVETIHMSPLARAEVSGNSPLFWRALCGKRRKQSTTKPPRLLSEA